MRPSPRPLNDGAVSGRRGRRRRLTLRCELASGTATFGCATAARRTMAAPPAARPASRGAGRHHSQDGVTLATLYNPRRKALAEPALEARPRSSCQRRGPRLRGRVAPRREARRARALELDDRDVRCRGLLDAGDGSGGDSAAEDRSRGTGGRRSRAALQQLGERRCQTGPGAQSSRGRAEDVCEFRSNGQLANCRRAPRCIPARDRQRRLVPLRIRPEVVECDVVDVGRNHPRAGGKCEADGRHAYACAQLEYHRIAVHVGEGALEEDAPGRPLCTTNGRRPDRCPQSKVRILACGRRNLVAGSPPLPKARILVDQRGRD